MSFAHAVRTCFRKYTDFSGRASRSEYWWWVAFYLLCLAVPVVVGNVIALAAGNGSGTGRPPTVFALLAVVVVLGLFLPTLAVFVRRLHDSGNSGAWSLLAFIPCVGSVVVLIFALVGSAPDNQYGPRPQGTGPSLTPPPPPVS